jgi:hypothetical protein
MIRLLYSLLAILAIMQPLIGFGISLPSALRDAVRELKQSGKIPDGITNYYTESQDEISKRIESDLFFVFEKQFPGMRLVDIDESVTGVSSGNSIFIKGNYQQKGNLGTLYLKAFKGTMAGEVIYQAVVEFDMESRKTTLVAVLDIEAKFLNKDQSRIFSDVFREALGESGAFNMASSADVDRMKPDELQKTTGCTGDSCAALIGKQLGVDRVIVASLRRLNQNTYYFSGKIMNIQDGSIVSAKTVKHTGELDSFDVALVELAEKLTKDLVSPETKPAVAAVVAVKPVENELVVYDEDNRLYWQKGEAGEKTWANAVDYCKRLNLADREDWRLPDQKELESSHRIKDRFPELVNNYYWSATTNKNYNDYAWGMTSSTGGMFDDGSKTSQYNVRCVRGEREPEKPYISDTGTGLEWQKGEGGTLAWLQAMNYCEQLELNGERDWRLPGKSELITTNRIKDRFPDWISGYYWTSTVNNDYQDYAWGMESDDGTLFDNGHKESQYNVRCVRGKIDAAALTLKDEETGLIWQKGESGAFSWEKGNEHCRSLELGGTSDWRLPNKDELESTFAIQDQFPGLINGYYWSSTPNQKIPFWAWGMTTSTGSLFSNGIKIKSYNIRCVRGTMK